MWKKISSNKTTTKKIANSNTSYVHTLKIFFFCSCCCCWEMCTKKFYRWTKVYRWIWNYITNSMRIFFFASLLFVFCMFLMMIITGKPEKNSRWISRIEKFICIHPLDFHMITCVCVRGNSFQYNLFCLFMNFSKHTYPRSNWPLISQYFGPIGCGKNSTVFCWFQRNKK